MEFNCVKDCSQCCIDREYYPSKKFGKIGVLILPEEKQKIESLAESLSMHVEIIPRIGVSDDDLGPSKVIAYQMIGRDQNGNTCPFLDMNAKSPHGGFACKIYTQRPLACRAYPLIDTNPFILDQKCKFCDTCPTADSNLNLEVEALVQIKNNMNAGAQKVWRYATGIGEQSDLAIIQKGWIREN